MTVDADRAVEPREHVVQLYDDDRELAEDIATDVCSWLAAGDVVVTVAIADHAVGIRQGLLERGVDVDAARSEGRMVVLDAADTLSRLLVEDAPDPASFDSVIGGVVRQAASTGRRVRVYGEMVTLLWESGNVLGAVELERLWNRLGEHVAFSLTCSYRCAAMAGEQHVEAVREMCALHSGVAGSDLSVIRSAAARTGELRRAFEQSRRAVAGARRFVADALRRAGRHDLVPGAQVVVSELVTNGVLHAASAVEVVVACRDDGVRIEVHDEAEQASPVLKAPTDVEGNGRGLLLVAGMAAAWGSAPTPGGKVVWAELA